MMLIGLGLAGAAVSRRFQRAHWVRTATIATRKTTPQLTRLRRRRAYGRRLSM